MEQTKVPFYQKKKFLYEMILAFFIIGIFGSMFGGTSTPTTTTAQQSAQTVVNNPPAVSEKVSVGEEGYINPPSPKALIANTQDGYKEITKIFLANDMYGVQEFLLSNKGFAVPKGTKIQVVDTAVGVRKVRVLEGDFTGQAGWIAMEWVSKIKVQ